MFSGLCAFPLTPMDEASIDDVAFVGLISRLARSGVDSICVLGSTGSYAYLSKTERMRVARLAVENAGRKPVIVGVSALRTRDVIELAEDAQNAGGSGVLLAPMSYQALSANEVYSLYEDVSRSISVPLCVYDNPGTTRFEFTDELHGRIALLPNVASIKIPALPNDPGAARDRVARLRALIPAHVTIGISGDGGAAEGLNAGCEAWYSVIAGLFPCVSLEIMQAAQEGTSEKVLELSHRLDPIWSLFGQYGSLRVIATAAEVAGHVSAPCLPRPLESLQGQARDTLAKALGRLSLS